MNKKVIYLIAAAALLAVLTGLYFYGADRGTQTGVAEEEQSSDASAAIVQIENIKEIDINNPRSQYTVYFNDDKYFVKGYENNSFSQNSIKYLFSVFSNLNAVRIVEENAEDLSKYGLETPLAAAVIKGDESITINIGDATPDGKYVYVSSDLSRDVYMVQKTFGELLFRNITELIDQKVTSVSVENVNFVNIVEKGKPEILIANDENNEALKNYVSTSGLSALVMKSPIEDAIVYPTNMQDTLLCDISSMTIKSVAELTPSDLGKYGLTEPFKIITVKDTGSKSLTIKIGNSCDKDSVYVTLDNKPEVYTLDNKSLAAFNNINIMDFVQNFVSLYPRSMVDSVVIKADTSQHRVEFKTEGDNKIAVDEEGVRRDNRNTYIDGKLIDKEKFGDFYEALVGIGFDSVDFNNTDMNSGLSAVIEFNLTDGSKDIVSYYDYNDNFYYVKNDGDSAIRLVNKQQISQLIKYIGEITKQ